MENKNNIEYMYSTAANKIEAKRLAGLNILHNPYTLSYLRPYLTGGKSILELGCGSGHLALDVMKLVDSSTRYLGVDRDAAQVNNSSQLLKAYSNAEVMQLDVLEEFNRLKERGPFDVIYCRWLLVHVPNAMRVEFLKNVLGLLSETGVFLCDECDNRTVQFRQVVQGDTATPYEKATRIWSDLSLALMGFLKNDLELTPEKITQSLLEASNEKRVDIKVEGQYQIILRGSQQKRLITDGYRSSSDIIFKVYGKPIEDFIDSFDVCVLDDNIECTFLTQNVVTCKLSP